MLVYWLINESKSRRPSACTTEREHCLYDRPLQSAPIFKLFPSTSFKDCNLFFVCPLHNSENRAQFCALASWVITAWGTSGLYEKANKWLVIKVVMRLRVSLTPLFISPTLAERTRLSFSLHFPDTFSLSSWLIVHDKRDGSLHPSVPNPILQRFSSFA